MSGALVVYLATAAMAVVIGLSRFRRRLADGRVRLPTTLGRLHFAVGAAALLIWVVYLILGERGGELLASVIGIVALTLWWLLAVLGFLVVARWIPGRGRRAATEQEGGRRGRVLGFLGSAFGQVVTLVAVAVFTYAYATQIA